jgi:hypothetical protein
MIEPIPIYIAQLPIWVSMTVTVIFSVFLSLIGTLLTYQLFTYRELSANNDIVNAKYGYFGGIFAVSLGLALVGAYGVYMDLRDSSIREVGALRSLYSSLPSEPESQIDPYDVAKKAAIINYAQAIVGGEWTIQAKSEMETTTSVALKRLFDALLAGPSDNLILDSHMHWINDAIEAHSMRTATYSRTLSIMIWTILLFGTFLALTVPLFIGTQYFMTQALLSSGFSVFIMLHLLVIIHLAYPINEDLGFTAEPYTEFVREVQRLPEALKKQAGAP